MKHDFLNSSEQSALKDWYDSLDHNRAVRARLRRAEDPEDILLTDAFFHFLNFMPEMFPKELMENKWQFSEKQRFYVIASIAGLLSHVKQNNEISSFAKQLAGTGKDRAPMSELRFQQLLKSPNHTDFYRRMIRAIRLLNGSVNVISLANDVIQWFWEHEQKESDRYPSNRLAVRWATDYFTALPKNID
ncbi:type I-E CRISPR-associated protein Cse2/CasB [Methylobacter sp. Wu1]|uniref:type I-E CRISPR-associated protein Cse2/CasB n=1 Tax=Methylobacter sp. Wu1 TaxID=3119359 RepID=UPI002F932961